MNDALLMPGNLSDWSPQRKVTLLQVKRRSAAIELWRMFFVAGAAISAGIFIGPITASAFLSSSTGPETIPGDEVVTMLNPRFTGRNMDGESYLISADTARRRRTDGNVIDLLNPRLRDEKGTEIEARTGIYDQNQFHLDLYEDVRVRDGAGYSFTTGAARMHIREGWIEGLEPLNGSGPLGDVRANTYEILDDGDRIVLKGSVDMVIYPAARTQSDSEAEEE